MNTASESLPEDTLEVQQVADYLIANPDFLRRHPEVLAQLQVEHNVGPAVSLIEHQVKILRAQVRGYNQQLKELILVARDNDQLVRRLHNFTLAMLECATMEELEETLNDAARAEFEADAMSLNLFAVPGEGELAQDPGAVLFREFIERDQPVCGALPREQLDYLFGPLVFDEGSVAIIPLRPGSLQGVLAIGSHDASRFDPGQGVDFLQRLGDLVSGRIQMLEPSAAVARP